MCCGVFCVCLKNIGVSFFGLVEDVRGRVCMCVLCVCVVEKYTFIDTCVLIYVYCVSC